MSRRRRRRAGSAPILLLSALLFSPVFGPADGAGAPPASDDSIVLEESQIFGKRPEIEDRAGAPPSLPALSTALPWEEEAVEKFNIPEEILDELTRPDPAFLSEENFEPEEKEALKGE